MMPHFLGVHIVKLKRPFQAKDDYISTPVRCSITHKSIPSTSLILPVSSAAVYTLRVLRFLTLHTPLHLDVTTLRQALKAVRQIGNTSPLKDILGAELTPGPTVNTDSDWEEWIRNNAATEFHPIATCAMLPEAQGGVVDANLKVYGTCTYPSP